MGHQALVLAVLRSLSPAALPVGTADRIRCLPGRRRSRGKQDQAPAPSGRPGPVRPDRSEKHPSGRQRRREEDHQLLRPEPDHPGQEHQAAARGIPGRGSGNHHQLEGNRQLGGDSSGRTDVGCLFQYLFSGAAAAAVHEEVTLPGRVRRRLPVPALPRLRHGGPTTACVRCR